MSTIKTAVSGLKQKLPAVAEISGRAELIASQEVGKAVSLGVLTRAQGTLLNRAISDSTHQPAAIAARLDRYVEAFEQADTDADGRIGRAELDSATSALRTWAELAATVGTPDDVEEAARRDVVSSTVIGNSGRPVSVPEWNINPLLRKLDAVVGETRVGAERADLLARRLGAAIRSARRNDELPQFWADAFVRTSAVGNDVVITYDYEFFAGGRGEDTHVAEMSAFVNALIARTPNLQELSDVDVSFAGPSL